MPAMPFGMSRRPRRTALVPVLIPNSVGPAAVP